MPLRVVSAIMFYPRGGSAHAARALARGLTRSAHHVTLVAGSKGPRGTDTNAATFYRDVPHVRPVRFDQALGSADPIRFEAAPGSAPLHPSFEDRPGAPDAVFASLDDLGYERQVAAWACELARAGAAQADVLHLHHLTPVNEAAARVAPHVPVVGQLHGTEMLMLEQIEHGAPDSWRYGDRWAERMRGWARRCERIVVHPAGAERAASLLGLPAEAVVPLPNGVDIELFHPLRIDRAAFWHEQLVEHPAGWLPGAGPGSSRYSDAAIEPLLSGTVLIYAGRFTAVKRLDFLIEAFVAAQRGAAEPAGLVLVGGHPGEWEGEHPAQVAERLHTEHVFLAGWHPQEELPAFFSAADAVVMSSQREQFGQVLAEGMSCAIPAIATSSIGPASIIADGRTGWLVPDDRAALARALAEAIADPRDRRRRGAAARRVVREQLSWTRASAALASVLEDAAPASLSTA